MPCTFFCFICWPIYQKSKHLFLYIRMYSGTGTYMYISYFIVTIFCASLISSLRFHTETLAYFKTLWFVSLYEITFHNGLLVKPYLFAHPNPINVIISWTISWHNITIFLFCMVLIVQLMIQLIIALIRFGWAKR